MEEQVNTRVLTRVVCYNFTIFSDKTGDCFVCDESIVFFLSFEDDYPPPRTLLRKKKKCSARMVYSSGT